MQATHLPESIKTRIDQLLSQNKIVLFMKGSPSFPQCGFSARSVAILRELGVQFQSVDVLEDSEMREAIKIFGQWPTIPQLYVNKQLIGGSDIMMEMFETGELEKAIQDA